MPDKILHFTMLTFIMLLSQHTCHSYMTGIMLHIFLYFQLHYGTDAVRDDAYAAGFLFSECREGVTRQEDRHSPVFGIGY